MQNEQLKQRTIDTYNTSAKALAEYFKGIGPRIVDIDRAFKLAGNPVNGSVLEIGCGDGRDAKNIVERTNRYRGFDVSESMIELARKHVPAGMFEVADALEYNYPKNLDIVFAFASLLHLDKEEVGQVLGKVHSALRPGGIFYISLKEKSQYTEEVKEDKYGSRLFFFYNAGLLQDMTANSYEVAGTSSTRIGSTDWFEIALRKI